jgi:succinate dehydrogenase/fumarate reductase flavoprotein subunit
VVVVGYGLAGGVAAIEASNNGADVLILEKSQHPGGCSILSGGMALCARDVDDAAKYLRATQGDRVDENTIYSFAQDLASNEEYLSSLAQPFDATIRTTKAIEPGKQEETGYLPLGYPYPGYETFYRAGIASVPGFSGFDWVQRLTPAGVNIMKIIFDSVEKRSVGVMLSTPAKRLITDVSGAVIGIIASRENENFFIKAKRGVVLACGGFEQNDWLIKQCLQGVPFFSMAPLTHTGDGIMMAQKVGAALWHMWHVHGSYGYKFDEFPIAFRTPFLGSRNPKRVMPWIVVDKFGSRYMNEYPPAPQDTGHRPMELFDPDLPGYSRIPSYLIIDDTGIKRGPIAQPAAIGGYFYEWSRDNSKEIDQGWILREESIEKLALTIRKTANNQGKMDPYTLEATVAEWNQFVSKKKDPLHRPPDTMVPINTSPFYCIPVWPIISNTQGGPQHNIEQQVLDPYGEPIPGLYAAGELGSFWSDIYLLAGNLGECLSSGATAGRNAAKVPRH